MIKKNLSCSFSIDKFPAADALHTDQTLHTRIFYGRIINVSGDLNDLMINAWLYIKQEVTDGTDAIGCRLHQLWQYLT